jgi:hypothetical protein
MDQGSVLVMRITSGVVKPTQPEVVPLDYSLTAI